MNITAGQSKDYELVGLGLAPLVAAWPDFDAPAIEDQAAASLAAYAAPQRDADLVAEALADAMVAGKHGVLGAASSDVDEVWLLIAAAAAADARRAVVVDQVAGVAA